MSITIGYELDEDMLVVIYPTSTLQQIVNTFAGTDDVPQELIDALFEGIEDLRFIFTRETA